MAIVCVSGGFDPVHSGHIAMIKDAAAFGDVVVLLNSDEWLRNKKGYCFLPFEERKAVLESVKGVVAVFGMNDSDDSAVDGLRNINPDYFVNGGDRLPENTPEGKYCVEAGIKMIFRAGGAKTNSSSEIVQRCLDAFRSA